MHDILVVDDDASIVRLLSRFLQADGHRVVAAHDVQSALDILRSDQPIDLAVLDFWIGDGTGLDVLESLRCLRADLPVIFLSGGAEGMSLETTAALAEMQGAAEFLFKPIDGDSLRDAVRKML